MKPLRLVTERVASLTRLELDFAALGPGVIAITGRNGSLKSHVVDLATVGTLYRCFPSYKGELVQEHFEGSGSITLDFEHGGTTYTARLQGKRSKTPEAYLSRLGEERPFAGPKTGEYDAAVAKLFPPASLMMQSLHAPQTNDGGLLSADENERQAVFAYLLGLGHYDRLSERLGERLKLTGRLAKEAAAGASALATIRAERAQLEVSVREASDIVRVKRDALTVSERSLTQGKTEHATIVAANTAVRQQRGAIQATYDQLAAEQGRLTTTVPALERDATQAVGDFDQAELDTLVARQATLEGEIATLTASRTAGEADIATIDKEIEAHRQRLYALWEEARTDHATTDAARLTFVTARTQAERLHADMTTIDLANPLCAACRLTATARDAQDAKVDAARAYTLAQGGASIQRHRADTAAGVQDEMAIAAARRQAMQDEYGRVEMVLAGTTQTLRSIVASITTMRNVEVAATRREGARTQLANVQARLATINKEMDAQTETLKALVLDSTEETLTHVVAAAERAVKTARDALNEAEKSLAALDGRRAPLEARLIDAERWEILRLARQREVGDGDLLQRLIGGERMREIATLCPAIEVCANELLDGFFDGRFAIRIDTRVPLKSGKGERELFIPTILDQRSGRPAQQVSGGERAILAEALRMAVCIAAADRAGLAGSTLGRDEMTGHLDPENSGLYVGLMQRVLARGQWHQILFVSHQEHVWQMADRVVRLRNGTVEAIE